MRFVPALVRPPALVEISHGGVGACSAGVALSPGMSGDAGGVSGFVNSYTHQPALGSQALGSASGWDWVPSRVLASVARSGGLLEGFPRYTSIFDGAARQVAIYPFSNTETIEVDNIQDYPHVTVLVRAELDRDNVLGTEVFGLGAMDATHSVYGQAAYTEWTWDQDDKSLTVTLATPQTGVVLVS